VEHFRVPTFALDTSGDIEKAAEIPAEQHAGASVGNTGHFVRHQMLGYLRILDTEGAAEPAAHIAVGHFAKLEPGNLGEQRAWLVVNAELAKARAGIVIGGAAGMADT